MSELFEAAPAADEKSRRKTIPEAIEECYVRTAEALSSTGVAVDKDIFKAIDRVRESQRNGIPLDLLEALATVLGHDEGHLSEAIASISDSIAATINPIPPTIPFASKLIAPSAFYESFEDLHKLAKGLLVPVLYVEDTDAIGTGSINPIASAILGDEIRYQVGKRFGIHPFLTCARMDYESWSFLSRKHFEL